jgi:hypothetical protein
MITTAIARCFRIQGGDIAQIVHAPPMKRRSTPCRRQKSNAQRAATMVKLMTWFSTCVTSRQIRKASPTAVTQALPAVPGIERARNALGLRRARRRGLAEAAHHSSGNRSVRTCLPICPADQARADPASRLPRKQIATLRRPGPIRPALIQERSQIPAINTQAR